MLIRGLDAAGWDVPSPDGSMFAWAPIPPRFAHLGSVEFSKLLLARAKVAVAPGIGFGEHGDGHVRIAPGREHPAAAPGACATSAASCNADGPWRGRPRAQAARQ